MNIVGIKKYEELIRQEIARIKSLSPQDRVSQKWAGFEERPKGSIWDSDSVTKLNGVGAVKESKLKLVGIETVGDMASLVDVTRMKEIQKVTRIQIKSLKTYQLQAVTATRGDCPFPKRFDWVEGNSNPYLARFGDNWREEMKKFSRSGLTRFCCVTELIEHIDRETKKIYKDTPYENNYYWAHDALNQMCSSECKEWMKTNGYFDRWIKPELGCNDIVQVEEPEKKSSRRFKDRPVGNQPELMPLDASLNWDIDCSLNMHVLMTYHLKFENPLKFRKDNPSEISKAILKLYHPETGVVPSSKRIIEDVKRVLSSIKTIVEAGGKVVRGLVNRNGHRNKVKFGRRYYPRKKEQTIKTMDDMGIFKEVQKVALDQVKHDRALFNK